MIIACIVCVIAVFLVGILTGQAIQEHSRENNDAIYKNQIAELRVFVDRLNNDLINMSADRVSLSQALEKSTKDWKRILQNADAENAEIVARYKKIIDGCMATIEDWKEIAAIKDRTITNAFETSKLNRKTIEHYAKLVEQLNSRIKALQSEIDCEGEEWKRENKKTNHPEDDPNFSV